MSLVYSLKLLCDVLFYMTFAGLISAFIGVHGSVMTNSGLLNTLPFLVISAVLLGASAERKMIKYLVFLPLFGAAAIAYNDGLIHLILLGPAIAYIIYYATTLPYDIKTVGHSVVFRLYLIIVTPICIFFSANFTFFQSFMNEVLGPYLIMFAAASIVLMRMIRHDIEVLNQRKFRIINMLSVAGVVLAGIFLGSGTGIRFMLMGLSFLYFRVFIPILYFILLVIGVILYPFTRILGLERMDVAWPEDSGPVELTEWVDMGDEVIRRGLGYQIVQVIVFIALGVAAFFLLRALFRFLTHKQLVRGVAAVKTENILIKDGRKNKRKEPRVNHQIRQIYRKFLKLCKNKGITLHQSLTTEDIAKSFGSAVKDKSSTFALREIYIDSRYGEKRPTSADIKECKELYNKLKKMDL